MPVCASKLLLIQSVQAIAADVRDVSINIEPLKVFLKKNRNGTLNRVSSSLFTGTIATVDYSCP